MVSQRYVPVSSINLCISAVVTQILLVDEVTMMVILVVGLDIVMVMVVLVLQI